MVPSSFFRQAPIAVAHLDGAGEAALRREVEERLRLPGPVSGP